MEADWSDSVKWGMDLLKNVITFAAAALVSLFAIDRIQEQRVRRKAQVDAEYAARLGALDEFRTATVQYDAAADAAFSDLFQWSDRQKTAAMVRYEQDAYPTWLAAVETAEHMYPTHAADIKKLIELAVQRHKIYDALVDERLDSEEPAAAIDPWRVRAEFRTISHGLRESRSALVKQLQSVVFTAHDA